MNGAFSITDTAAVIARLETEKARILGRNYRKPANSSEVLDTTEKANGTTEFEKEASFSCLRGPQLAAIDKAKKKAEDGTYGLCECCGHPIDPARLETVPWALTCENCPPPKVVPMSLYAAVQSSAHVQRY